MTNATITKTTIVTLNKSATRILSTRKGARLYACAFVLSDGSFLVSKTTSTALFERISHLSRLTDNVANGVIHSNINQWDPDELARYKQMTA